MILAASFGLPYWPDKLGELGQLLSPTVFTYEDLQKPIVYEQWAFVRVAFTGRLGEALRFVFAWQDLTVWSWLVFR